MGRSTGEIIGLGNGRYRDVVAGPASAAGLTTLAWGSLLARLAVLGSRLSAHLLLGFVVNSCVSLNSAAGSVQASPAAGLVKKPRILGDGAKPVATSKDGVDLVS